MADLVRGLERERDNALDEVDRLTARVAELERTLRLLIDTRDNPNPSVHDSAFMVAAQVVLAGCTFDEAGERVRRHHAEASADG